jgi:hypothetical protein
MTHHTIIKSSLALAVALLAASLLMRQLDAGPVEIIADALGVFGLVVIFMAGLVSLAHRDADAEPSSSEQREP